MTLRDETEERLGSVLDDHVVDPKRIPPRHGDAAYGGAIAFIRAGEAALQAARRMIDKAPASARAPLSKITLTAPMRPPTPAGRGSLWAAAATLLPTTRKRQTPRSAARSPSSS